MRGDLGQGVVIDDLAVERGQQGQQGDIDVAGRHRLLQQAGGHRVAADAPDIFRQFRRDQAQLTHFAPDFRLHLAGFFTRRVARRQTVAGKLAGGVDHRRLFVG